MKTSILLARIMIKDFSGLERGEMKALKWEEMRRTKKNKNICLHDTLVI